MLGAVVRRRHHVQDFEGLGFVEGLCSRSLQHMGRSFKPVRMLCALLALLTLRCQLR